KQQGGCYGAHHPLGVVFDPVTGKGQKVASGGDETVFQLATQRWWCGWGMVTPRPAGIAHLKSSAMASG
ncbi:MAG TPA: hypothetical protein VGE47_17920, partial [Burkholderiaceae bacterium]